MPRYQVLDSCQAVLRENGGDPALLESNLVLLLLELQFKGINLTPSGGLAVSPGLPQWEPPDLLQHLGPWLENMRYALLEIRCHFRPTRSTYIPFDFVLQNLQSYRECHRPSLPFLQLDPLATLLCMLLCGFWVRWSPATGQPKLNVEFVHNMFTVYPDCLPLELSVQGILQSLYHNGLKLTPGGIEKRVPYEPLLNYFDTAFITGVACLLQPYVFSTTDDRLFTTVPALLKRLERRCGVYLTQLVTLTELVLALMLLGFRVRLGPGRCKVYVDVVQQYSLVTV